MTLVSLLMIGFLLGLKHATEADHVAAVATLVTRGHSIAIAVPLRFSARHADWAHTALSAIVGAATVGLGLFMVYLTGFDE